METLILDQSHTIPRLILNRPSVHNAFNAKMIQEFTLILKSLKKDPRLPALIIKGEGKSFCAGGDLQWMKESVDLTYDENVEDALTLSALYKELYYFPKPVITLAHGSVYGGGVGLVCSSDIVIAHENTKFCLSEVKLGLVPSVISPFVLMAMGKRQAMRYMLTAEVFSARQALNLNIVHEVTNDLEEELGGIESMILNNGAEALSTTKSLVHYMDNLLSEEVQNYTADIIAQRRSSDEGQEGLRAFFAKEKPAWYRGN